jgi:hypothetical protein
MGSRARFAATATGVVFVIVLGVMLVTAQEHGPRPGGPFRFFEGSLYRGSASQMQFSTDFEIDVTGGQAVVSLKPDVSILGQTISCLELENLQTCTSQHIFDLGDGSLEVPNSTTDPAAISGRLSLHTTYGILQTNDGSQVHGSARGLNSGDTTPGAPQFGMGYWALGGTEITKDFTYDAEVSACNDSPMHCSVTTATNCDDDADCTGSETCVIRDRNTCRGGMCFGTEGSGTCYLFPNSNWYINTSDGAATARNCAIYLEFDDMTVTEGKVKPLTETCSDDPDLPCVEDSDCGGTCDTILDDCEGGIATWIRVHDDLTINEDDGGEVEFDFTGMGSQPGSGTGACENSTAGKPGANNDMASGGAAGTSACTAGGAGASVASWTHFVNPMLAFYNWAGTASGAGPTATGIAAPLMQGKWSTSEAYGATGGGGGGCAGSCSGSTDTGYAGAGFLRIEVGDQFLCEESASDTTTNEFSFGGTDGTASTSSGGSAGGSVLIIARNHKGADGGEDPLDGGDCDYDVAGGAGGTAMGNCCAGGTGGNGEAWFITTPGNVGSHPLY